MEHLLAELHRLGIRLQPEGNELRVLARPGALDERLRQALRTHKAALLEWLRGDKINTQAEATALVHDAAGRFEPFPLTELQHAYWLGRDAAMDMGSVATHLYVELACRDLDLDRAGQALRRMIDRHDMLRAVVDGTGQQRVLAEVPAYVIAQAGSRTDAQAAEAAALTTREALSHQVLKPGQWPLFDIRATLMPQGEVRLHVSLDLLILDAWSIFLFFREWHRLYLDPSAGVQPAIGYRDYVLADQARRTGPAYAAAQAYWDSRIDALPAAPALPLRTEAAGAGRQAPRFRRREARLAPARWAQLKQSARERGLTPSGLMLAAYAEILARWSSTAHFTLNVTTGTRQPWHPQVHQLLGDFTSLVLHEVDRRDAQASFTAFANGQQARLLQDLEQAAYSGLIVRREWARRHGMPLQAALPVVFSSGLVWSGDEEVGNLEQFGTKVHSISQTSQVWLDHHVMELGGELVLIWDAVDAVFEPGVLDAMFESYTALLDRLANDPAAWDDANVTMLPAAMQQRRDEARQTALPLPAQPLHAAVVAHALAHPHDPAIIAADRTLSFGQWLDEACAAAGQLIAAGLQPGDTVAVVGRKGWEQAVAVLGTLLGSGAYVPVDADLPVRRQLELLALCGARHMLAAPDALRAEVAAGFAADAGQVIPVLAGAAGPFGVAQAASLQGGLDRLAYVIFTSGTTGVPKGVMIEHAGATNTVEAVNRLFDVSAGTRVLGVSSLSFDLSVYDIFGVPGAGGALVLPDARAGHDPAHWLERIVSQGVTLWNSAPQLMHMLLDALSANDTALQALQAVMLSGDFIPPDLPGRLRRHGCAGRISSLGGATEASIWSIHHPITGLEAAGTAIPYGRALPNQTVEVLDTALRPVPDWVRGRIFIGGIGLARGYLGDAQKTAQRFITHPRTGERLYDTGDLGRVDAQGDVLILGRDDRQIKVRGHRVELGEIEAVLRRHPGIDQAVVLARTGAAGQVGLLAYVVPRSPGDTTGPDDLRAFAAEALPDYMVPRQFVTLERIPLSANGKVDFAALPAGAPDETDTLARIGPRDAGEAGILQVWTQVIPGLEIGVTDNFFDLGGDSVLATQLLRELNAALPVTLEMHDLFENLTIEALARLVRERQSPGAADVSTGPEAASGLADTATLLADVARARELLPSWRSTAVPQGGLRPVLLTGATGWVGLHLLAELIENTPFDIVCLVRGDSDAAARERLAARWRDLHGSRPWPAARVRVLHGDLTQERFGLGTGTWDDLAADLQGIYHLGASVAVLRSYPAHRADNVAPLHELLRLAAQGAVKQVVTLSPMTVCRRRVGERLEVAPAEQLQNSPEGLLTAYAQSKWVAEQVLWAAAQQGLPVRIYRCSHALPSLRSGLGKPNDSYGTVLDLARRVDVLPDWPEAHLGGLPVDRLCELLVEDAHAQRTESAVVHLDQRDPPRLQDVLAALVGERLAQTQAPRVSLGQWQRHCLEAVDTLPAGQQLLARGLFETHGQHMPVENMFSAHTIDTHRLAQRRGAAVLSGLTPPAYWRQAFPVASGVHTLDGVAA